ncbi:unnamed protein product, partial [marine sediment metagenome]
SVQNHYYDKNKIIIKAFIYSYLASSKSISK